MSLLAQCAIYNPQTGGASSAAQLAFSASGDVAAAQVQAAIEELDSEKLAESLADPAADHAAVGIIETVTVGGTISDFGTLLRLDSDGKWYGADADAANTVPGLRLSLNTAEVAANGTLTALVLGKARDGTWEWTVGGLIYASTVGGGLTQAAPSGSGDQVQVVGIAYHADKMIFCPSPLSVEVA